MPTEGRFPGKTERALALPFSVLPHKAQLEESPRVDVDDVGRTVSQGSFPSECSRDYFQQKEEKTYSVPSRSQCEKQMGRASHKGRNYNPNQYAYIGHWIPMSTIC